MSEMEPVESAQATPPCPGGTLYTIRAGDTLWAIAQRYGTTVAAIVAANPGIDPNRLAVGQVICVPVAPPAACPPGSTTYVIRPGDTLWAIAQRFGVTVDALLRANPGVDPLRLAPGQVICIPPAVPMPPVTPRDCAVVLSPRMPTFAPNAGGVVWVRVDAMGRTQLMVAAANLPDPTALEPHPYRAIFAWERASYVLPLAAVPGAPGVYLGTVTLPYTFPPTFFTLGAVDVFPGPVLGGLMSACR